MIKREQKTVTRSISTCIKAGIKPVVTKSDYNSCSRLLNQITQVIVKAKSEKRLEKLIRYSRKTQSACDRLYNNLNHYVKSLPEDVVGNLNLIQQFVRKIQSTKDLAIQKNIWGEFYDSMHIPYGDCLADSEFIDLDD